MQTQSNFDQKNCRQARVAVVSFDSLGDSLLYILLAHNLHKNNFEVSYFGTVGYQLAEWMPNLRLLPYPDFDSMDEILAHYDLVLMSPPKQLRKRMAVDAEYLQHLRQRYLLICQKAPPSWDWNHVESLNKQLSPDVFEAVKRLIQASSSIRFKQFRDESAVDILMAYMQEKMGLRLLSRKPHLVPPDHLKHRRYDKRVIISPDSAGTEDKDWGKKQFLSLCAALTHKGFEPVIVVSLANYQEWLVLSRDKYKVPSFDSIADLAAYIYESAAVVANDSGNGHLASFLGVPVVTIYKKRNEKFHWRPSWGGGKVVCPKLVVKFGSIRIWRPFVTKRMVLKALEQGVGLSK